VPSTPSEAIGRSEARKRCQPTRIPPSKRIATSATTAIRSTSRIDSSSPSRVKVRPASAAASRKIAGAGTAKRSLSLFESTASAKTPATAVITKPKSVISVTA
jgi:hypothetical protein